MHLFLALGLLIVCGMVDATFYNPRSQTFNQLIERRQRSIPIPYFYGYHYNPIEPSMGLDSRINTFKPMYQNVKMSTHDVNSVPRTQYQPKNSLYDSEYVSVQDIPSLFPEEDSYDYKYLSSPLYKYLTQPSTQESGIAINLVAIKKTSVFDYGFPTYKSPYLSGSVWDFGSKIPNTVFEDPQSVESDPDTFRVSSPTVKIIKLFPETSEKESIITTTKNDELNYITTQETPTEAELYPTTSEELRTEDEPSFITTEETQKENDESMSTTSQDTTTALNLNDAYDKWAEDKLNPKTSEESQPEDEWHPMVFEENPTRDDLSFLTTEETLTEGKSNSITTEGTQTEDESNSIEFNSIKTEDKSNSITIEETQKEDDESMSTTSQETTTAFNLNDASDTNRVSSSHAAFMIRLRDLMKRIEDARNKSQFRTIANIPATPQSNLSSDESTNPQSDPQLVIGPETYEEY